MDQVKYLKLEKNVKNGTVRTHGPAGKYKNYGHNEEQYLLCCCRPVLVLINLATLDNQ